MSFPEPTDGGLRALNLNHIKHFLGPKARVVLIPYRTFGKRCGRKLAA